MTAETAEPVSLGRKAVASPDPDESIVALACEALVLLGDAGKAAEAGAIAGRMWTLAAGGDAKDAARLNAVMHRLAKLDQATDPSPTATDEGTEGELDAQSLHPSVRHDTIFAAFAALPPGAAFVLRNSPDPKPLRYQFEGRFPGQFTWDYLETGPDDWKIRIGRHR
jgi:uncharacterized protein (DUF2249 family)